MFSLDHFQLPSWKAARAGLFAMFVMPLSGCGYVTAMTAGDEGRGYDASTGVDRAVVSSVSRLSTLPAVSCRTANATVKPLSTPGRSC